MLFRGLFRLIALPLIVGFACELIKLIVPVFSLFQF